MDAYYHRFNHHFKYSVIINDIAYIKGGKRLPKGHHYIKAKSAYKYLRVADIGENEIDYSQLYNISEETYQILKRYELNTNDLVISIAGTIGKIIYFQKPQEHKVILTENAAKIVLKDDDDTKCNFLNYVLQSDKIQKQIKASYIQTTIPKLSLDRVGNLKIPLPPKETQAQIVAIMDKAYTLKKEKEEKAAQLLKSIDGYILEQLGIQLPKIKQEKTFIVYAKELEKSRADVYYHKPFFKALINCIRQGKYQTSKFKDFITNIHYGASVKNNYIDEGIPLLRILNLRRNEVDTNNIVMLPFSTKKDLGKAFVKEGDILISRSGSTGITSVVPKEANGFAFGSFMIKAEVKNINKNYLCFWLNNYLFQKIIERVRIGAIQGNITIPIIENFIIPLPPLEVQNQIAQEVQKRMHRASALKQQAVQALQQAKQEVENILFNP